MNDELFTITESKPDPLTAARSRLARAQERLDEMDEDGDETSDGYNQARREYRAAKSAIIALETEAMKSL